MVASLWNTLAVTLGLSLAGPALAACALEHGYIVCHAVSAAQKNETLSFAPLRVVSTSPMDVIVCGENSSGFVSASSMSGDGVGSEQAVAVLDQQNGCATMPQLTLAPAGKWTVALRFGDGDAVAFVVESVGQAPN